MKGFRAYAGRISLLSARWISVLRTKAPSVSESLPSRKLLAYAPPIARQPLSARFVRVLFTQPIRRRLFDYDLALEGLAAIALSH